MKVNNASQCIENAKRDLDAFRDELGGIRDMEDLCVDIDGLLTFADFFFDGFLVDFDQAMKRMTMYKTEEGRAMLRLQEGDTHHGGCGQCGGDK